MKENKHSPPKLKQSKITAFWLKPSAPCPESGNFQVNEKKRNRDDGIADVFSAPNKKISLDIRPGSPDLFHASPERDLKKLPKNDQLANESKSDNRVKDDFEDFVLEDFENNPFLSPKKDKSPRKGVLTENCSQASEETWHLEISELNFEVPLKCRVFKTAMFTVGRFEQILQVIDDTTNKTGVCKLRDAWTFSSFSVGDQVVIQTVQTSDGWVVDNKMGYVVLHPNIIVSSTSLVNSMFCLRKGLFSQFYRGIEPGSNDKMLMGRLVHELLQECLKTRSCTDGDFSKILANFLTSREYLLDIYLSGSNVAEIKQELENYVPRVRNFLDTYVNKQIKPVGKNFSGSIEDVLDIEELIRSPNLGFQGRVDVSVKIKLKNTVRVAPLELKTGRASFSNEHRNQLILYILLMNEIGRKVESGLLLYLKEGILEEIVPKRDEIRNIFLLRNRIVGYYRTLRTNDLPDPIRNVRSCNYCPYLKICTSYLRGEDQSQFYDTHPIRSIDVADVLPSHVEYFARWNNMLWLEFGDLLSEDTDDTEISGLKLMPSIENFGDEFKHTFSMTSSKVNKNLMAGSFVHLLDGKGNRITTAKVIDVKDFECSLSIEKKLSDLLDSYKIVIFKLKFLNFYLSNLGLLLNEEYRALREKVIDKRTPHFQEKLDKKSFKDHCLKKLIPLNKEQQKAVLKSLLCTDYLLIKGPPGTGKTQTIAALVRVFLSLNQTVLLSGHTNTSVDNILLRLDDVEYLRLGSLKSINKKIHRKCYANLVEDCKTVSDIRNLFERKVIASTCSGIDTDFVYKKKFDVCIVDESSQVLQPEVLRPLFCCKKFILVGDEDQLPPVVQNKEAKRLGMEVSMFEWLANDSATVKLKFQYRMNSVINAQINGLVYNGLIECANEEVAKATIQITNRQPYLRSDEWIKEVLSSDLERSVIFVDTSNYFDSVVEPPDNPRSSRLEANIVTTLVASLLEFGLLEESVGIIAPFSDQVALIRRKLVEKGMHKVELNTVDQYQGRDKDVILFSCGKENQRHRETIEFELLSDMKRLTVAITRAKYKLILVGDKKTVVRYHPFEKLLSNMKESAFVCLVNGAKGFFWSDFQG